MFEKEPPIDWSLAKLPQVISTPHIAASTEEAQELVGLETAATVRDFLRDGTVRNAVNFPSMPADELQRLQPWIRLAESLGAIAAQMGPARVESIGVRYYGALAESRDRRRAGGQRRRRRPAARSCRAAYRSSTPEPPPATRAIDIVESRSSRPRDYTACSRSSCKPATGERWVEGTVFEPASLRLVSVRGVSVEAPLGGTIVLITNDDQPGVIGEVGTILGRHASTSPTLHSAGEMAARSAIVSVDEDPSATQVLDAAIDEIRRVPAIREAWVVRLS